MEDVVRQADIVIAAAGQAGLIKGSWIKPGVYEGGENIFLILRIFIQGPVL